MHAMFFGFKRVHLRVVGVTRELLRGIVLTPARFDVMRIIKLHGEFGILQCKIQNLLGVSAPTVSVMLRSLELLGFVKRSRFHRDERCVLVRITEVGIQQVELALERLIEAGVAERLAGVGLSDDPEEGAEGVRTVRGFLNCIRRNYADAAAFEHPWTTQPILPHAVRRAPGLVPTYVEELC